MFRLNKVRKAYRTQTCGSNVSEKEAKRQAMVSQQMMEDIIAQQKESDRLYLDFLERESLRQQQQMSQRQQYRGSRGYTPTQGNSLGFDS